MNRKLTNIGVSPSLPWIGFLLLWIVTPVISLLVISILGNFLIVLFGAVMGLWQWMLMRKQISLWWIAVTGIALPIGYGISLFTAAAMYFDRPPASGSDFMTWSNIISGFLGGMLVGTTQWPLLRRCGTQAKWWLVAVPIGWILGFYIAQNLPKLEVTSYELDQINQALAIDFIIYVLSFNMVVGIVTGLTLIWLLYKPVPAKVILLPPYWLSLLAIVIFLWIGYFFMKPEPVQVIVPLDKEPDLVVCISRGGPNHLFILFIHSGRIEVVIFIRSPGNDIDQLRRLPMGR